MKEFMYTLSIALSRELLGSWIVDVSSTADDQLENNHTFKILLYQS